MTVKDENVTSVFFDAAGLNVSKTWFMLDAANQTWIEANYTMTTPNPNLGDAIEVMIPTLENVTMKADDVIMIKMWYITNENTTAISWMTPSQTACGQLPYLFTQCEDIACRSVAPMQDTPANRITYSAQVVVRNAYNVHMSANSTGMRFWNLTHTAYSFENTIPMPSYLIAIAVGYLDVRSLDARTSVITEHCKIDEVASVLDTVPDLLNRMEAYITPYIWGTYSILVLPPSFPMGGMENPLLTFASPTIITADKSQVYVATHEIAHSWTGNQVTCENWSNFWLNEGFTVFEERKISGDIHGKDFSLVNAYLGNISMYSAMQGYGLDSNYSSLYPMMGDMLTGAKPDDSFSEIPYEKGFQFLWWLQTLVGEANYQTILRAYINEHSLTSINATAARATFERELRKLYNESEYNKIELNIDWTAWVVAPGLPQAPVVLDFMTPNITEAQALAMRYIENEGNTTSPENFAEYNNWYSSLKVIFLEKLIEMLPTGNETTGVTNLAIVKKVDEDLKITTTVDPECKQRWFPLGIMTNYTNVTEPAHEFISSMGRMKYLTPIYQALIDTNQTTEAVKWYNENVDFYHPYAVEMLAKLLGITAPVQGLKPLFQKFKQPRYSYQYELFLQ